MNVSLTPELEAYIADRVDSGLYRSRSEVVREAVRLLMERDRMKAARMEKLRTEVGRGLDQARSGELIPGDEVFAGLHREDDERAG